MSYSRGQLIFSTFCIGIICIFARDYTFSWGDVVILKNGATFNDLWYFNLSTYSDAFFIASLAITADHLADEDRKSYLAFILKYISIGVAMLFCTRAIFHIFTYNLVSIYEMIVDILLLIHTIYRAVLWYKHHLKRHATDTPRYTMEDN